MSQSSGYDADSEDEYMKFFVYINLRNDNLNPNYSDKNMKNMKKQKLSHENDEETKRLRWEITSIPIRWM